MASELLPCPFCLGKHVTDRHVRDGRQMFCQNCGASVAPTYHGPNNDTLARAAAAWNTRATLLSAQEEEIERLRKALVAARKMIQTRETVDEIGWGKGSSPATRLLAKIDAALTLAKEMNDGQ